MFAAIDSWLFFLLIAIAALLRWLATKATTPTDRGDSQDKSPTQQDRPAREIPTSDQEQIRKFLEALGQPKTSKPPPPLAPRTNVPPRPIAPVRPPMTVFPPRAPAKPPPKIVLPETPPATKTAEWLKKIKEAAQAIEPAAEPPAPPQLPTTARKPAARRPSPEPLVEAYAIAPADATTEKVKVDLQLLLASPSGLRNAIILREIFGPPRSLQPLQDLPGIA